MPTYRIDAFAGGRDKRPRMFYGKEKDRFKNLDDAYIGKDRKVHRRFPLRFVAGTVTTGSTDGFGAISIDGVLTYFAPKTATPVVSIAGITTAVLQFDEVGGHVADRIIDAKMFNGHVVALIRHAFTSTTGLTGIYTYKLHVFDGLAGYPTFVTDPYFPTSWGPTLPLHTYRTGAYGARVAYVPRMGIAAGKVYVSGPDHNLNFSAPSDARTWNTRTYTQIRDEGEWFYWPNYDTYAAGDLIDTRTATNGVPLWCIPLPFTGLSSGGTNDRIGLFDAGSAGAFTCWVLEYCDTNGTWHKFIEDYITDPAPSVNGHYQVVPNAAPTWRVASYGSVVAFLIKMPAGVTPIIRFRAIAGGPPIAVTDGIVWSSLTARSAGSATYEGIPFTVPAATLPGVPGVNNYARLLLIAAPPYPTALKEYVEDSLAIPLEVPIGQLPVEMTGYARYTSRVLGWSERFDNGVTSETKTDLVNYLAWKFSIGAGLVQPGYVFLTGNESSAFRVRAAFQLAQAGNGLAGFLPTSTRAKADGGPITAISTIKDYIGVHYRSLTLLYAVNPNQLLDAVRDAVAFGTGPYTDGVVVQFHNQTILFSERGFRAFSVGGYLSDRADDTNIGEAVENFEPTDTTLLTAAYWPATGQYVAMVDVAGTVYLYVFDYSKDSKISCWSRWQIGATPSITGACALVVIGTRLYIILSAGGVAYLDASAAPGQWFDDLDLTGASNVYEYESVAETYQNDFGQSAIEKKFVRMDLVCSGTTEVTFNLLSSNVERNIPGTVIAGATYGGNDVRLAMRGYSVGVRFASTDVDEWILDSFALDFTPIQR